MALCFGMDTYAAEMTFPSQKPRRRRRHVPHRERSQCAVIKRNERERRRVHDVNEAFKTLQQYLPSRETDESSECKKISKMAILKEAIQYIDQLASLLTDGDFSDHNIKHDSTGQSQCNLNVKQNTHSPTEDCFHHHWSSDQFGSDQQIPHLHYDPEVVQLSCQDLHFYSDDSAELSPVKHTQVRYVLYILNL